MKTPDFGSHDLTKGVKGLFHEGRMEAVTLSSKHILAYTIRQYSTANTRLARAKTDYFRSNEEKQIAIQEAQKMYDAALIELLDSLHEAVEAVDTRLETQLNDVREVIALHFATILDNRILLEQQLAAETKDNTREQILIKFYFDTVYPVVTQAPDDESSSTQATDAASIHSTASNAPTLSPAVAEERRAVWLALMFRMWSWLFLHEFSPEDKMIERSEFYDSRLPVYIG